MTKEELAKQLNNCEYGDEIREYYEDIARKNGLVVIFGASDDLCEFRGSIYEEISCYNGRKILFSKEGDDFCDESGEPLMTNHKGDLSSCKNMIEAVWCSEETESDWSYKTTIPHATFNVMEDGSLYCVGIVFSINDLM